MAKRIALGLLVLASLTGVLGAQESSSKIAISLDPFPLVKGIDRSNNDADNSLPKFFLEPPMSFVYAKTPSAASVPTPLGWQPGLGIAF